MSRKNSRNDSFICYMLLLLESILFGPELLSSRLLLHDVLFMSNLRKYKSPETENIYLLTLFTKNVHIYYPPYPFYLLIRKIGRLSWHSLRIEPLVNLFNFFFCELGLVVLIGKVVGKVRVRKRCSIIRLWIVNLKTV